MLGAIIGRNIGKPIGKIVGAGDSIYRIDFTTGTLDPRFSVTRATNATRTNTSTNLEFMGNNVARIDCNPLTGAPIGFRVEKGDTNYIFPSNAAGAINAAVGGTATYAVATGPDGATSFNLFTENTSTGPHRLTTNGGYALSNGAAYTVSMYLKPLGRTDVQISAAWTGSWTANFDLTGSGVVGTLSGCTATVNLVNDGTYYLTVTATAASTIGGFSINSCISAGTTSYLGDGRTCFYWYGLQIEQKPHASTYIPTVGSALARNSDVVNNVSYGMGNLGADEGSFYLEGTVNAYQASGQNEAVVTIYQAANPTTRSIRLYLPNWTRAFTMAVDNTTFSNNVSFTVGTKFKIMGVYKNGACTFSLNGASVGGASFDAATVSGGYDTLMLCRASTSHDVPYMTLEVFDTGPWVTTAEANARTA